MANQTDHQTIDESQKQAGFSLWCDFVERDFLENNFKTLLQKEAIKGATSNPSIFANAILTSPAYKSQLTSLKGKKAKDIYEALAIADIKKAASILKPLWEANKDNGYISIEIDPLLGENAPKSIDEGKRLFQTIDAENVMIKVPATEAGYEVMDALFRSNISINATLIFSPQQAKICSDIFKNAKTSSDCEQNRAVISVFVSRFDRAIDSLLQEKCPDLQTKIGIYNAMQCYHLIEEKHDPFTRTLFASTGVKTPELPKDYYIDALLLAHCINTAPLDAIQAYIENPAKTSSHKLKTPLSPKDLASQMQKIKNLGIDMPTLYKTLMQEGLGAFIKSFEDLLRTISS
ncbi:transaldolase [Helicobacter sp. 11S02596-1]|uniref:transaldolase n=1 Tax=Helicobacter sp. 11S02596-1 TaxID=1476194 RepID=UPI000BA6F46B|nr:transaldolase [Helicobacter sp. 11S02596-1]PAF45247.1 transaldolase [Helicobacter sp. 11S02596-1]